MSSTLLDRAAALAGFLTIARLLVASCLFLAPGLALSYWLYPRRVLDPLERAYLAALASLSLLTLCGVALLETEAGLDPWLLASCGLACTAGASAGVLASRRPSGGFAQRRRAARRRGAAHTTQLRGITIWVHGTRSPIPAPFVARMYPARAPGLSRRRPCARSHVPRITHHVPRPVLLLVTAALALLAYRAFGAHPPGGGPVVAFSIPSERLAATQLALRQGGSLAVPFQVENLATDDAVYRVELRVATGTGAAGRVAVAAGATYRGQLSVDLPAGGEDTPVDLYLFPDEAAVPLAHLRLWPAD